MKSLVFLVFFSVTSCFAQNLGFLFKDYFPQDVKLNDSLVSQAGISLKVYAELNPDMIYYYIEYLGAKFKSPGNNKYFLDNFNKIVYKYKKEYLGWIAKLDKQILSENIDDQLKGFCINYIDDHSYLLRPDTIINPSTFTDFNLLNFFAVKYYLNDNNLKYDPTTDYKIQRDSIELKIANKLKDFIKHSKNYTKYDLSYIFNNWFVYNDVNTNKLNNGPYQAITNVIRDYSVNNRLYDSKALSLGLSNINDNMTIPGNIYDSPDFSLPDSEHVFNTQTISVSFEYKMFLSKYILPFSYINFQMSAGYSFINKSFKEDSLYRMTNVDNISNRNKILIFSQNDIKVKSIEYLSLNISTPVYFVRHKISFEVGGGIGLFINSYTLNYNYTYREFDSEFYAPVVLNEYSSGPVSKNSTSTHFTYYPLLNIKYYLNSPLLLELSASNKIVSIDIGLNL